MRNLWIVFLLSGLWHGANWTFVIWGAWHGLFLTLDRFTSLFRRLPAALSQVLTLILVMLGWVWFRSESLNDALQFFHSLMNWSAFDVSLSARTWFMLLFSLVVSTLPFLGKLNLERLLVSNNDRSDLYKSAGAFILLVLALGQIALSHGQPFIYFRF